ncbi:hypothetical protein R1sor_001600 [Riccia sorocarpa]|uniref:Maturase K n=1 Tax=Riccia sorocarpa TaxID=122646 RepID=A0ABD3GWR3_9MARC
MCLPGLRLIFGSQMLGRLLRSCGDRSAYTRFQQMVNGFKWVVLDRFYFSDAANWLFTVAALAHHADFVFSDHLLISIALQFDFSDVFGSRRVAPYFKVDQTILKDQSLLDQLKLDGRIWVWEAAVRSLNRRVTNWDDKLIIFEGRVILLRHILGAIPIHTLAVSWATGKQYLQICRQLAGFLWGSRTHLTRWTLVEQPFESEGLGIRDLRRVQQAFYGKAILRLLLQEQLTDWMRVLVEICRHRDRDSLAETILLRRIPVTPRSSLANLKNRPKPVFSLEKDCYLSAFYNPIRYFSFSSYPENCPPSMVS